MRKACPNTRFFCVVPPLGWHAEEIRTAVAARNQAGDTRVHLIDTATFHDKFRAGKGATQLAEDGVHPTVYGQALLGAAIAAEARKFISE